MIGSFDRLGFARHRRHFRPGELDVDLAGRVVWVTGGNAGLGRATAEALLRRGATVHLLARDPGRGEAARHELRRTTGNPRVELGVVDLSDLGSIRRFVAAARPERIHALIHNAGLLPDRRIVSAEGLELTFATHVVGPHLLTRLVEPALVAAGDARVVFVSSGGMYTQRLDLDDLGWERRPYDGVIAYAMTKRMQVALARSWAERLGPRGVSVYAMHPGWADTGGVRTALPRFHRLTERILRTAEEGADTIVWLAVRRPAPAPTGGFWFDRTERWAHYLPWTRESAGDRAALWARVESAIPPDDQPGPP